MKKRLLLIMLCITSAVPLIGYCGSDPATTVKENTKPLYWVDTMEPGVHYTAPGKSRMGMELVPVYPHKKQTNSQPANQPSKE